MKALSSNLYASNVKLFAGSGPDAWPMAWPGLPVWPGRAQDPNNKLKKTSSKPEPLVLGSEHLKLEPKQLRPNFGSVQNWAKLVQVPVPVFRTGLNRFRFRFGFSRPCPVQTDGSNWAVVGSNYDSIFKTNYHNIGRIRHGEQIYWV